MFSESAEGRALVSGLSSLLRSLGAAPGWASMSGQGFTQAAEFSVARNVSLSCVCASSFAPETFTASIQARQRCRSP